MVADALGVAEMLLSTIMSKSAAVAIALAVLSDIVALCLPYAPSLAGQSESNFAAISGKPIEIKADSVERNDQNRTAIFRGNALATLGGIKLTSAEIYVTYSAISNEIVTKQATSPLPLDEAGQEITQIEGKGRVLVALMDEIEAKGELAVFDLKKQQLTMNGEVTLSQRENLICSTDLNVDLATGFIWFGTGGIHRQGERRQRFTPRPELQR